MIDKKIEQEILKEIEQASVSEYVYFFKVKPMVKLENGDLVMIESVYDYDGECHVSTRDLRYAEKEDCVIYPENIDNLLTQEAWKKLLDRVKAKK